MNLPKPAVGKINPQVQSQPAPQPTVVKEIPLFKEDISRLRKGSESQAVAAKAYDLDSEFRSFVDHYYQPHVLSQLPEQDQNRLPDLLLNQFYYGSWELDKSNDLTEAMSQGATSQQGEPGFLGRVQERMQSASQGNRQAMNQYQAGNQGATDTIMQVAGNTFSGLVAPATEATSTVVQKGLQMTGLDEPLAAGVQAAANSRVGQAAQDFYRKLKRAAPAEMESLETVGKAIFDATDVYGSAVAAKGITSVAKGGLKQAGTALSGKFGKQFDEIVADGMAKGVKPQFRGAMRSSATSLQDFNKKASEAVREIIKNQDAIEYLDDAGDLATTKGLLGKSVPRKGPPKNLAEFAQAIEQTKKKIFTEYSALTQQATGQGMSVELDDIVEKLIDYADDPVKQLSDKAKTEYALQMADQLMQQKTLDPIQAESLIKELNQSLAKAYADKSAKGVSEVDLSIANILRDKLDDTVFKATGKEYQPLKNAYGSLKAIEKDVGHRALVVARQNTKGFADMTDIFTGGDLAAAVITSNPTLLVRGAAGFGIKNLYQWINSPDANVMRMFHRAGRAVRSSADDAMRLTPEEQVTGLIGGSDFNPPNPVDDLNDVPLSQLDSQGTADAAAAQKILDQGGSIDDAAKVSGTTKK